MFALMPSRARETGRNLEIRLSEVEKGDRKGTDNFFKRGNQSGYTRRNY